MLIADELTPSLAAQVDWTKVRGFATDAGSRTYHTAILARSLEVPAVVGLHDASALVQAGQMVVIDGSASEIIIDPDEATLARVARSTRRSPARARPAMPSGGGRRRPPTACGSGSTRTSSSPTTWRRRAMPAPKASGCTGRSSC